jgi:GntR family transcriptional regulator, rspAB operon transcriptional repressor
MRANRGVAGTAGSALGPVRESPRLSIPAVGQPATQANLDDHIYERLKSMIVDGALLPGERIVPEQLAGEMGVSRTPMLSALKRLAQERLITWRSRRGVFVRRLTKRELAMVFEVREMLEGLAARRAATVIEPRQVEQLRALFAGIDTVDMPENRRAYMHQDYLFHAGILDIAASPPLAQTMHSVNILALAFGAGLIKSIQDGLTEHEAILEAMRRHDPDAAEAAMRAHIRRSVVWLHHEADALERTVDGAVPSGGDTCSIRPVHTCGPVRQSKQ